MEIYYESPYSVENQDIDLSQMPEGIAIESTVNISQELKPEDILLSPEQFEEFETEVVEDPDFRKPRKMNSSRGTPIQAGLLL